MAVGPGKYDDFATLVRGMANADGVVVIVVGGPAGSGFSVQGDLPSLRSLPALLRTMADEIERDTP